MLTKQVDNIAVCVKHKKEYTDLKTNTRYKNNIDLQKFMLNFVNFKNFILIHSYYSKYNMY